MSLTAFYDMRDCRSKQWLLAHLDYPHKDWCLLWPFARKGGGYVAIGAGSILVHRVVCEYRNGPALSPTLHAAHSCGRGDDGCINPWHLNWRTPTENQLERFEHHGLQPRFKLTAESAARIRDLKGFATSDAIAQMFGVSESNVRLILTGKTWKTATPRVFSETEIQLIRSSPPPIKTAKQLAAEYDVSVSVIDRIRQGKSYRYFESVTADGGGK